MSAPSSVRWVNRRLLVPLFDWKSKSGGTPSFAMTSLTISSSGSICVSADTATNSGLMPSGPNSFAAVQPSPAAASLFQFSLTVLADSHCLSVYTVCEGPSRYSMRSAAITPAGLGPPTPLFPSTASRFLPGFNREPISTVRNLIVPQRTFDASDQLPVDPAFAAVIGGHQQSGRFHRPSGIHLDRAAEIPIGGRKGPMGIAVGIPNPLGGAQLFGGRFGRFRLLLKSGGPEQPPLADFAFGQLGRGLARSPKLVGDPFHFAVALRIVAQARRFRGPGADHRRARFDQFLDLAEQLRRHRLDHRQNQQPIAHSVGQHEPAVLDRHPRHQRIRRTDIEVVSGPISRFFRMEQRFRHQPRLSGKRLRHAFAAEIADVGREQPLPQEVLASGEILVPGRRHFPPGLRPLIMHAPRAHRHPGPNVQPRLHGVAVDDQAVDAFAERPIAEFLEDRRMLQPTLVVVGAERLGADDLLAPDVPARGHHGRSPCAQESRRRPDLAHRLVGPAGIRQLVAGASGVGFGGQSQAVAMSHLAEMPGVILQNQFVDRLPKIPEESFGDFAALDDPAGDGGQIRKQIVSPAAFEFLAEFRRPILSAAFPTVDVRGDQGFARQRPDLLRSACPSSRQMRPPRPPCSSCRTPTRTPSGAGEPAPSWCGPCEGWSICPPGRPKSACRRRPFWRSNRRCDRAQRPPPPASRASRPGWETRGWAVQERNRLCRPGFRCVRCPREWETPGP